MSPIKTFSFTNSPSRRAFLGNALALGLGSLLLDSASPVRATDKPDPPLRNSQPLAELAELPKRILIDQDGYGLKSTERQGSRFTSGNAVVNLITTTAGQEVRVCCPTGPLSRVVLRWETEFPLDTLFLGDAWERGYGDLQWRFRQPERIMPWYFAAHQASSGRTFLAGVKTQPSALCFWMVDAAGISLWLDFRNGGGPSRPGKREIKSAVIISHTSDQEITPTAAITRFCQLMCPSPRLPSQPICGNNNWYYAYGRDFDADAIRRDATFLGELAGDHHNRPFCVIDAGWTPGSVCPGGPWQKGDAKRFPDMPGLAADLRKIGVRPGIWMRPTALTIVDDPSRLRAGPVNTQEKPLDLTLPENLELIHADVARVRSWGYDLIKHDFSTYDILGKWGFEMGAELTEDGWHFQDQTLTNAEIILRHYQNLRAAIGDGLLLGCNTIGHLGAGLFEIQRAGDDTSGHVWERTRRMGINTLAYRLAQNGTFFACDRDCAAHTNQTHWYLDRQFLDLVARSGAPLFISVDPRTITPEQKTLFQMAMQIALSGGAGGGAEPLDWLYNTAPAHWLLGVEERNYHWEEAYGSSPMKI